jgi:hypothetical protein
VGILSPFDTSRIGEGTIPTIGDPDVMSDTTAGIYTDVQNKIEDTG